MNSTVDQSKSEFLQVLRPPIPLSTPSLLLIVLCSVLTIAMLQRPLVELWAIWTTDPLRSIGLLLPPVSLWLALRTWSWTDWKKGGTWWGLVPLLLAVTLFTLKWGYEIIPAIYMGDHLAFSLVPTGPLFCLYISGLILLFGGLSPLRKAWFAVLLWLFVNPVPYVVGVVDMPLQTIAALSARTFAGWLSVPVTGDALTLMFSPNLGMFLAPGCNGLRGAATMGYLALVLGYVRNLTWPRLGIFVIAAVAFAYVLNLVRLFIVVMYYWLALRVPLIGEYGAEIDYVIGGLVFLSGTFFLFRISGGLQSCNQKA